MFTTIVDKLEEKLFHNVGDPLEAQMKMVNYIQQFVGNRNVFGEKGIRSLTVPSVFLAVLFGGAFVYVGPFSQTVFLVQVVPDKIKTFQGINCLSSTQVPLSKFVFMFTSSLRLNKIVKMSREGLASIPTDSVAHKRIMSILRKARIISWLVLINQTFTHFVYLLLPFFLTIFGSERYLPTTPGNIYGMNLKYESPYYEMTFFLTIVATLFSCINQTGYIILFVTLLSHELGHFYAICEILDDVHKTVYNCNNGNEKEVKYCVTNVAGYCNDDNEKHKRINELLLYCVKHHQFLMTFHSKISELYKVIFGLHFLVMVLVLVTTLQTMNSWGLVNTALTGLTGVMPLVVYCFGGELLLSAGLSLCSSAYACGWEGMRPQQARLVMLLLCTAQRPRPYTAAGMFRMNRETFGDVVQVVYKIYAVFN